MAGDSSARVLVLPARGPLGPLAEEGLSRLARRGDRQAFEAIFRRYQQELYRFCRDILADPHEAHDALQNTMEAALRALPDEERRIALRSWLYRVAHNESISILRRRTAVVDPMALPEGRTPRADAQAEPRERLRQLIADLEALPDRQRGALVMRELSGLDYSEIGEALGASEGAVRQLVYEARLALRDAAQGRELECDAVRRRLSERDGRILRGRLLRAHLRDCEPCRDFRAAIGQRRGDLRTLCPPLAPASGLLAALLGKAGKAVEATGPAAGSAAGTGAGAAVTGAGLATTSGSWVALKAASIAATVALGAGAAGVTGTVDLPLGPAAGDPPTAAAARATPASPHHSTGQARSTADGRSAVSAAPTVGHGRHAAAVGRSSSGNRAATGEAPPTEAGSGASRAPPGGAEPPASPPGGASGKPSSSGAAAGDPPPGSPPAHTPGPPPQAQAGPPPQTPGPPPNAQGGSPPRARSGPPPQAQAGPPPHAPGPPPNAHGGPPPGRGPLG